MAISRREILRDGLALGALGALRPLAPSYAATGDARVAPPVTGECRVVYDLVLAETPASIDGQPGTATTINGTLPGPVLRFREGEVVTINVTNRLKGTSSIHWHGVLVPPDMDGVPGVSFAGIEPSTTFTYRLPIKQYGTYWYHSHSGGQEQSGIYGPIIIDPIRPDPVQFDREYVIMLSDWTFQSVDQMMGRLKKAPGYFNFQKRTVVDFVRDVVASGVKPTLQNYLMWSRMRMDPTDLADVTAAAYTYLMNGVPPAGNWTALFRPRERVRLRFIGVGVQTFYDVRIPGLAMTVVQADGQNVRPVEVDEIRIGPAETYDVIVQPGDGAYTIFAETLDRSGYARGTLATRAGITAPIPPRRPRPLRTMQDMGMEMPSMNMAGMANGTGGSMPADERPKPMPEGASHESAMAMPGMDAPQSGGSAGGGRGTNREGGHAPQPPRSGHDAMGGMSDGQTAASIPGRTPVRHGPDHRGPGNQSTPDVTQSRLDDPGIGLGGDGRRVLVYTELRALEKFYDTRPPERELEIHLTGHMERFIWSFDGDKYADAPEPVQFRSGERLRWTFVNDTMMEHTMHLHGMWMHLENGAGEYLPRKHTVIVKPAERVSVAITADADGRWAFHCHLLLHMEAGMFRVVEVSKQPA